MSFSHKFGRPVTVKVDLMGHPMLEFLAEGFLIESGVVLFFLGDSINNGYIYPGRLVQLIPLEKIEHMWQIEEDQL